MYQDFEDVYQWRTSTAMAELGNMFDHSEYPLVDEIRRKFVESTLSSCCSMPVTSDSTYPTSSKKFSSNSMTRSTVGLLSPRWMTSARLHAEPRDCVTSAIPERRAGREG